MTKSRIFLIFCLSFILGVFLGEYLNYEIMAVAAMIFVILGTIFYSNRAVFIFAIAGVVLLFGAFRYTSNVRQNDLAQFYGQKITGVGVIVEEPDQRSDKTFLTIGKIIIDGKKLGSKALIYARRYPEYEYGQKISFEGKLTEPKEAQAEGEFSYKNYLSRFGVDALVYYPKISVEDSSKANPVKYYLLKFKQKFVSGLAAVLPEPQNAFLAGLLVGLRRAIPQDLTDALAITGTTHVIAISGFNITIIANTLNNLLLRFLKRKISFFISLATIVMFVILTGASASAVRAGIMGALGMLALRIGRVNNITNALVLTATAMLVINPQILRFDAGFQLSFLALIGLVYISPMIESWFSKIPKGLRFYLIPTTAAYLATLPILIYDFGRISLVAIIVNVLVLPMIPAAMLFGFVTGVLGMIWTPLAAISSWLTWGSLTYVLEIVMKFSKIPFASINYRFGIIWVFVYYLAVSGILFFSKYPEKLKNLFFKLWKRQPKTSSSF